MPEIDDECSTCDCGDEATESDKCPNSQRQCGHHCNHSWSHESCCWCGKVWNEVGVPVTGEER